MKCIILAAGYATRMYPLTENFPKPLLEVKGKAILDWIVEDLDRTGAITELIVISNHKFIQHFTEWSKNAAYQMKITVLDDGTVCNEKRLGAVRDIAFAVRACNVQEETLVLAGDNLMDFSMKGFLDFYAGKQASCIMCHYEKDIAKLQKTGVIRIADDGRVLDMQEKPREPQSNWAVPPFYIYSKEDLEKILYAVDKKCCNVDAPGDFIAWLCRQNTVYAYKMPGKRFDIGSLEGYEEIKKSFCGLEKK